MCAMDAFAMDVQQHFIEITWILYVMLIHWNYVDIQLFSFFSQFLVFPHLFISNTTNNYSTS
jgi:hypothetical protein